MKLLHVDCSGVSRNEISAHAYIMGEVDELRALVSKLHDANKSLSIKCGDVAFVNRSLVARTNKEGEVEFFYTRVVRLSFFTTEPTDLAQFLNDVADNVQYIISGPPKVKVFN